MGNNIYILKHKDISVLKFSFNEKYEINNVLELYEQKHIPVGVFNNENLSLVEALQDWWKHRTIPASRDNLEDKLEILNVRSTVELLNKSYGLSLTDHYWIMPADADIKWHDINYYENSFSDIIGKILFDNVNVVPKEINYYSPDNSSDGNLRKKWIIEKDGTRVLIKGGDVFSPQESFNEVISAKIFELLEIPHARYTILEDKNKKVFYSKTPNFTNENIEFINANHIVSSFKNNIDENNKYEFFIKCCENVGINRNLFEKDLVNMFLVDFIIANKDRHYRNFGFLRNSETLEWIGLAPVYDSGNSLFEGLADVDLHNDYFIDSKNIEAKPFAVNQEAQIKLLPVNKFCKSLDFKKLEPLHDFIEKILVPNYRMSDDRKKMINQLVTDRIQLAQKIISFEQKLKDNNYDFGR